MKLSPWYAALHGLLAALAPLAFVLPLGVRPDARPDLSWITSPPWWVAVDAAGTALLAASAWAVSRRRELAGMLVPVGVTCTLVATISATWERPLLSFLLLSGGIGLVAWSWYEAPTPTRSHMGWRRRAAALLASRSSALAAMGVGVVGWFAVVAAQAVRSPVAVGASAVSLLVSLVFASTAARPRAPVGGPRRTVWWLAALAAASGMVLLPVTADIGLSLLLAASVALLVAPPRPRRPAPSESFWMALVERPAPLLVVTFLALSILGTSALALPAAATEGHEVTLLEAAFTAVSATCVTGLIVVDTPTAYGPFGEAVVLVLIQLGGLGIMTFSTAALALLQRRPSIRHEGAVAGLLGTGRGADVYRAVRLILLVTGIAEASGALVLAARFVSQGEAVGEALWRGAFTAISAFCNAGFALQTDSLVPYQADPLVLHTCAGLIVLGGLGPVAVAAVPAVLRQRSVAVQAPLVLATTAWLLALSAGLFGAFEWENALADMPVAERLHNTWFQAVTLRTAGFNSVDFADLRAETLFLSMAMMFVGGSPGSTAGGIKTTTAAMLILAIVAALRGEPEVRVFGRRIAHQTVYRAAAVATLGALTGIVALLAILLTQTLDPLVALFEVVSAIGTVGLSMGGTAQLGEVGQVIIMVCMFAGRVGPLTLFLLLMERTHVERRWRRPLDDVSVG